MDDPIPVESTTARDAAREVDKSAPPVTSASASPAVPRAAATGEADAQFGASRDKVPSAEPVEAAQPPAQDDNIVECAEDNAPGTVKANGDKPAVWEVAREHVMTDTAAASTSFATPTQGDSGGGTGANRPGSDIRASIGADAKMEDGTPRSRGRPRGRPRGSGRGGRSGRGSKRKRDDEDEHASDSSDEVTPIATMTKSGRSIQKPASFVPPPQSPSTNKRKRPFNRRNPESAVCKACLRGTSPTSNMIVFCDGCNAPYHRWCHKPPIDQTVVEEVDREWFCKQCESERVVPVPESEVANFVCAPGASVEQRQKYFSSQPPGVLVTLLTKATTLRPDLPLFDPDFKPKQQTAPPQPTGDTTASTNDQNGLLAISANNLSPPHPQVTPSTAMHGSKSKLPGADVDPDEKYSDDVHPWNYPRPGKGLMSTLPPEQEDLHYLVDDDDKFGVFTHVYQKDAVVANAASSGHVMSG